MIDRIRFESDDGEFAVCELDVDDRRLPVTIVGNILSARPGETVEVIGRWKDDPKYGRQFRIDNLRSVLPKTREGIEKYLSSSMMEGIGPTLAERIVDHFGESTLEVLSTNPERIEEVEGIGPKRASKIAGSWREDRRLHELMTALRSHGISASLAVKIYERFGAESLELVRRDPYRLVEEIRGVGFKTADEIARHFGIERDSPARIRAGIVHLLRKATDDGHVFLPRSVVEGRTRELLGVEIGQIDDLLEELEVREQIAVERRDDASEAIFPIATYRAEVGAGRHLRRLNGGERDLQLGTESMERRLDELEEKLGYELADAQRRAAISAFSTPLSVITGGPGTGKTTIVQAVCRLADHRGESIALAAPTGRAARRLSEATGRSASTIHRLLEYSFDKGGFKHDENDPLGCEVLVVDEASMIDVYLLYALVRAVPTGAKVVFVGDIDQLPSVGPGQVLRDLIDSGVVNVVRLTEIFRQSEASTIVVNAHRINAGKMPVVPDRDDDELVDFYTINAPNPEVAHRQIVELVTGRVPDAFGFDPLEDIQVLSPMYRGETGCNRLNERLQQELCGDGVVLARSTTSFHRGDRVMQTRNNYEKDVFNGDVGRIVGVDPKQKRLTVDFDGRNIEYDTTELDELDLAYAITIHKSQGSEYPVVVVPVTTQHYVMLQRNLLYTAVTRGTDLVVLVGTRKAVKIAVENAKAATRYTRMAARLSAR